MSQGMSQPSQPPPLSLLRLRETDIVRLCGLGAAAQGLDLLTRRSLLRPRRAQTRFRRDPQTYLTHLEGTFLKAT